MTVLFKKFKRKNEKSTKLIFFPIFRNKKQVNGYTKFQPFKEIVHY